MTNPKERVKAIDLRSGRTYEQPQAASTEQAWGGQVQDEGSRAGSGLQKLHINIPLIEALEKMPKFAKFLKDILSNKWKLKEHETMMLIEESSEILQKKLPPTLKDLGSFTIPYTIGNSYFDKVLCNLGANINLMSLFVFRKLGLGEAKPTTISLQLANRSIKYPRGLIENILVKVDKFIFLANFVVLDMEEDEEIPLILGRPFLVMGRTLIDVQ
ncbi:uncharacterized protein LOC122304672 [Carya illinoinensis]|uniref:uncharacterized protein LOC122304672 n=1 Tax=Carya illinoinensis TaxID=32201 RepID=UPI001C7182B5|nr:uncharacterized protein LOC122304672 [Carya illinoinensis]